MLPDFLVPETTINADGAGPAVRLDQSQASSRVLITFGIAAVVEQELCEMSIWGSSDGETWGKHPIAAFPQKFYKGNSAILVDLAQHPGCAFLQAKWHVQRWGRGDHTPHFRVFVFAEAYDR